MRFALFISISLLLTLAACSPGIYLPERTNAPMLRESGEMKLTSSLKLQNNPTNGKSNFSPSLDFAVSPVKGMGITGSFRSISRYATNNSFSYSTLHGIDSFHFKGSKGELGLGYYFPFGQKGLFDIYAGGALGNLQCNIIGMSGNWYKTQYHQIFLQPSVGFHVKDIFEISGGIRFNYHKYSYFRSSDPETRYSFTNSNTDIEDDYFLFVCPFLNLNIGYKYVKFNAQIGFNNSAGNTRLTNNGALYASVGLTFAFAPRFLMK